MNEEEKQKRYDEFMEKLNRFKEDAQVAGFSEKQAVFLYEKLSAKIEIPSLSIKSLRP